MINQTVHRACIISATCNPSVNASVRGVSGVSCTALIETLHVIGFPRDSLS